MAKSCDQTFANVKAWQMTGFEDFVEITHGSLEASPWNAITRVTTHSHYLHASLPASTAAPALSTDQVYVHTLAIKGYPASGTIDWEFDGTTGTFDWDATAAEVETELSAIPSITSLIVRGGPLPYNPVKFYLDDGSINLVSVPGHDLVREAFGMKPKPEMTICVEPAALWSE